MRIACLKADNTFFWPERFRELLAQPPNIAHKGLRFLPVPPVVPPVYDPATEAMDGPTYVVNPTEVTEVWTKRAKTAPELDGDKEGTLDRYDRLALLVAFDMENRMRAQEAKAPITMAQYRAALKARL